MHFEKMHFTMVNCIAIANAVEYLTLKVSDIGEALWYTEGHLGIWTDPGSQCREATYTAVIPVNTTIERPGPWSRVK